MPKQVVIGIAGGSGAGKTTLSRRIFDALGGEDNVSYLIHDNYYRCLKDKPFAERANTNFDHPDSLETELLVEHLKALKQGQSCEVPTYDFTTHTRKEDEMITMQSKSIVLVEGILIFCHPELYNELDIKVFVDADSDIRLMRRLSRDTNERGRSVEEVLQQYHATVRPMHQEWVEPSKRVADIIVHSYGHSFETAVAMLCNHLRIEAGLPQP